MRAVIFVIIIVVLAIIVALATGLLHISPHPATVPDASGNAVTGKAAHTPPFDVQTGSVQVGSRTAKIKVPDVRVTPPADAAASNQASATPGNHS
jgi:hypothetical protein